MNNLSWRQKRQLAYLAIPIIPVLLLGGWLTVRYFTTASCSDGKINQGEQGIDCEGPCPQICAARIIQPEILSSGAYPTQPGSYNLAALLENRNQDLAITNTMVTFAVLDEAGQVIYTGDTLIDIRPNSKAVAFLGPVQPNGIPAAVTTTFDLTASSWQSYPGNNSAVVVESKQIIGTKSEPRVEAVLQNNGREPISDMPVAIFILDDNNQVVATSNTLVSLPPQNKEMITYTWPRSFPTTSGVCQNPVDVVVAIDASGSMNATSIDPPEPLSSVKFAAKRFAGLFSNQDRLAVVSFANEVAVNQALTTVLDDRVNGIDSVIITPAAEVGYTNVSAALNEAYQILLNNRQLGRSQAVVLLTDGQPTAPDGAPNPESAAITAANQLDQSNIQLFAIGLGDQINNGFLEQLTAGDQSKVFKTSAVEEVSTIYSQIASAVCERQPYGIELYPNPGI